MQGKGNCLVGSCSSGQLSGWQISCWQLSQTRTFQLILQFRRIGRRFRIFSSKNNGKILQFTLSCQEEILSQPVSEIGTVKKISGLFFRKVFKFLVSVSWKLPSLGPMKSQHWIELGLALYSFSQVSANYEDAKQPISALYITVMSGLLRQRWDRFLLAWLPIAISNQG